MKYFPEFEPSDNCNFIDLYRQGFDRYCRQLADHYGCLNNQGLALLDDDADLSQDNAFIDDLFVLPNFGTSATSAENFDAEEQTLYPEDHISAAKLLAAKPRQFILGDPGIGKTTFLHWLAISLAHHRSNYVQQAMGPLLPILLRVRDFRAFLTAPCNAEQFVAHLKSYLGSLGELLEPNALTQAMANGQVLLLVDGLDEIGKQEMLNLGKTLATLFKQYPSCRCIMTARVVGFDATLLWPLDKSHTNQTQDFHDLNKLDGVEIEVQGELSDKQISQNMLNHKIDVSQLHDFGLYYIQPLNNEQRRQFSQKWCQIYVKTRDAQTQFLDDLQAAFNDNNSLNNLSRTPVLLNMICFIQQRRGRLPNGRAELYQKIIETYLVSMDRSRGIENNFIDSEDFDYTDIRNWLAKLAYVMQLGRLEAFLERDDVDVAGLFFDSEVPRCASLTENELSRFFARELAEVYENSEKCEQTSRRLIDYIKRRTGFLIDRGVDVEHGHVTVFAFSHLSFQEYFAAHFISQQWSQLRQNEDLIQSLTLSCNSQSWFECWQLVFEDYSQNGNSRQQHTLFINLLFGNTAELASKFAVRRRMFDYKNDHAVHLLSKIILNPAVKLQPNYRQQQLTELWIVNLRLAESGGSASIYSLWPELCRDFDKEDSLSFKALAAAFVIGGQEITQSLNLSGCKSADLRSLMLWPGLKYLDISNTQVNNLQPLEDLTQLEQLLFDGTHVSDLAVLTKLPELKRLSCSNTAVANLMPLEGLSKLERLSIDNTLVTELAPLAGLVKLKSLNIDKTQVSDLTPLAGLLKLTRLHISKTQVIDLSPIAELTQLEFLILNDTHVTDLTALVKLTQLEFIGFNRTPISDLAPLARMTHLNYLIATDTAVSDLTPLNKLTQLRHLDISNSQVLNLRPLAKMRGLSILDVSSTAITDLRPLKKLAELRQLEINYTQVSDLTPLANFEQPIIVFAFACEQIDSASLNSLPEHIQIVQ